MLKDIKFRFWCLYYSCSFPSFQYFIISCSPETLVHDHLPLFSVIIINIMMIQKSAFLLFRWGAVTHGRHINEYTETKKIS